LFRSFGGSKEWKREISLKYKVERIKGKDNGWCKMYYV